MTTAVLTTATIRIERDALLDALKIAARAVGRTSHHILHGLLLTSDGEHLTITGSNLDVTITHRVPCGGDPVRVAADARSLVKVVGAMRPGAVELDVDTEASSLVVRSGKANARLRTFDADEYPRLTTSVDGGVTIGNLVAVLGRLVDAVSTDETRAMLCGINFQPDGDDLRLVATDSYRLHAYTLAGTPHFGSEKLVPGRALAELPKLFKPETPVVVAFADRLSCFTVGDTTIVARLIEANFPDTSRLAPDRAGVTATVTGKASSIVAAAKRVLSIRDSDTTPLRFAVDPDTGLRLSMVVQDVGDFDDEVDDVTVAGEPLTVAYNGGYLAEALIAADPADAGATILITDAMKPALVVNELDPGFLAIVMPVRVS